MARELIKDIRGGVSYRDSRKLKRNQFEELKNWFYNSDQRLQTRRGYERYFVPIPDTVVTIDACDATTGWAVSDDGATLATGTAIRGSNSLTFNVTVAGSGSDFATLEKSTIAANITAAKDYLAFWLFVPTGFNTNLTDVKIRLGTDASNYYEWTLPALTENANNFIKLNFSAATTTGTLNDASITYFRLRISYAASYTDKTGVKIDAIQTYSSMYTKPCTGYFSFRREDTFARVTIAIAGANMFLWNETQSAWERIDSGLTEFETKTGITTHRTRWAFISYLNVVYMCDGVNTYRSWNGTTITTYAGEPKVRYFISYKERIVSGGEDANPYTVYSTAVAPADATNLNAFEADIGWEEEGGINGLLWSGDAYFIVLKDEKKYYVSIDSSNVFDVNPITNASGGFSNRAFLEVGNGIMHQTESSIDTLQVKKGTTGGAALESEPAGADLYNLFKRITPRQRNANCGYYLKDLFNYYFSFDTGDDNVPETTAVYSSQKNIGAWTTYTYPALYQYGRFIDSNGKINHLICAANAGLIYKIETGFDDDGNDIEYSLKTARYDLEDPAVWKDWEYVEINGLKNEGSSPTVDVIVDGSVVYTAELDDTFLDISSAAVPVGVEPVGTESTGGGGSTETSDEETVDTFPYRIRLGSEIFADGNWIQIHVHNEGDTGPLVMTVDQIEIGYEGNTLDLIPSENLA